MDDSLSTFVVDAHSASALLKVLVALCILENHEKSSSLMFLMVDMMIKSSSRDNASHTQGKEDLEAWNIWSGRELNRRIQPIRK